MRRLAVIFALPLLALGAPTAAQTVEAIDAVEEVLQDTWDQTPLTFRNVLFATEATTYGIYTPRPEGAFRPGEPLLVYAEPVGYGFKQNEDGTYSFGVTIDLSVKDAGGAEVASQDNFAEATLVSRKKNREFIVAITLNIDGAPAGDYVVEYTAHDIASDETALISLPFTVAE